MDEMMKMKPMIHLSDKDLPAIKDWKVGDEYEITLRVKQKSMREMSPYEKNGKVEASFEIIAAKVAEDDKDVNDMSNDEFSEYASKRKRKEMSHG